MLPGDAPIPSRNRVARRELHITQRDALLVDRMLEEQVGARWTPHGVRRTGRAAAPPESWPGRTRARSASTMPLRPATPHYPQPGRTRQDASRARVPRVGAGRRAVPHRRRRGGATKLGTQIAEVLTLGAAHGTEPLLAALERAVTFGRWRADDVRPVHGRRRPCTPSDIGWSGAGVDVAVGADQVLGRLPDRHRCRGR